MFYCLLVDVPFPARGVNLDGRDIDPEPSIVRPVLSITIDLLLDPLNRRLVRCWVSQCSNTCISAPHTVDVCSVWIGQTRSSIAMTSEPPVVAIVVLAIPSGRNLGVKIGATIHQSYQYACLVNETHFSFAPFFQLA